MSCFMVDRNHIRYLVDAALSYDRTFYWYWNGASRTLAAGDFPAAASVGQMLWDANKASVNARYPDTVDNMADAPGAVDDDFLYAEHDINWGETFDPVQVLKACKCLAYQSCDYDGWEASQAFAFLECLKDHAINALPGYEEAEWGAPERVETGLRPIFG